MLVLSDAHEAVLAEHYRSCVVLGWAPVLSEHEAGALLLYLLQWKEDLASLLDLSEQVGNLLSCLGLSLGDVPVT